MWKEFVSEMGLPKTMDSALEAKALGAMALEPELGRKAMNSALGKLTKKMMKRMVMEKVKVLAMERDWAVAKAIVVLVIGADCFILWFIVNSLPPLFGEVNNSHFLFLLSVVTVLNAFDDCRLVSIFTATHLRQIFTHRHTQPYNSVLKIFACSDRKFIASTLPNKAFV
jgi:hypothetical protein